MSVEQLYNTFLSNHQFLLIQLVEMGNFYRHVQGTSFFARTYTLVMTDIAIEHGHRNIELPH